MYASYEDYFAAVKRLIGDLKASGDYENAHTIEEGYACINGLTDGWALFLESLMKVETDKRRMLTPTQKAQTQELCDFAYRRVYHRERFRSLAKNILSNSACKNLWQKLR